MICSELCPGATMFEDNWLIDNPTPKPRKKTSDITPASKKRLKELLYKEDQKCKHCHRKLPADLMHLDRIRPGAKGGGYTVINCQLLCGTCNSSKGAKSDSKAKKTLAPAITGIKPVKKPAKKKLPKNDDSSGWGFGF